MLGGVGDRVGRLTVEVRPHILLRVLGAKMSIVGGALVLM